MLIELIPAALHEQRLDRVVSLISDISRASTATLISVGGVQVDGVIATAGKVKVREGQQVVIDTSLLPRKELPQPDPTISLDIVYQDLDVAVINKAPGMVVHPGSGNPAGTMVNGARALFPEMATVGDTLRPGVVHRLDAGTTGLMVMARTQKAYDFLVDALSRRDVTRKYVALVFDVVRIFDLPQPCALIECQLETGRTHQIRVHLDSIGHPVVGDATYGGARSSLSCSRPMLHATALSFAHPDSGEEMGFEVPIPDDMNQIVGRCS